MIRGIYAAAAGMVAESQRNDVTANNLANVNTAGFKKDVAVSRDFASVLIQRINDGQAAANVGTVGSGSQIDEVATIHTSGTVRYTGNDFDLAIDGKGYFVVETAEGLRYTRNGSFTRNGQGELVTSDGLRVMGQTGPVAIGDGKMTVASDGTISIDGLETNQLRVVDFADEKQLTKQGASLFAAPEGVQAQQAAGTVNQGYLEMSNVNVVAEMVNMINGFRAYEINGKSVQAHDHLLDKAVNEVGRV
ncbi:MAG: flagellar basal-body rod protein FlgF [Veillonellaceae bacterium]|nr:flagellar basal-body rod protein FlgF [Veillonellaceae bacterium]